MAFIGAKNDKNLICYQTTDKLVCNTRLKQDTMSIFDRFLKKKKPETPKEPKPKKVEKTEKEIATEKDEPWVSILSVVCSQLGTSWIHDETRRY
jgi:hypothetical protein